MPAKPALSARVDVDRACDDDVCGPLLDLAMAALGADRAVLVDRSDGAAYCRASRNMPPVGLKACETLVEMVASSGAVAIGEAARDWRFSKLGERTIVCGSALGAALARPGEPPSGALWLFTDVPRVAGWTAEQRRSLEALANQFAAADRLATVASALAQSDQRLQRFVESDVVGVAYGRVRGAITNANDRLLRMLGYTRDDLIAGDLSWTKLTPDDWVARDVAQLRAAELTGSCPPYEKEFQHRLGYRVPVLVGYALDNETRSDAVVFVVDLTERKRVEALLRVSEERHRLTVEAAQDYAIYLLDADGRVASWNAGCERVKGYRADEVIGRFFGMFFTPEDVQAGRPADILKEAAEKGSVVVDGLRLRGDGSIFAAHVTLTALRDEMGELIGFSKIARDDTARLAIKAERDASEARLKSIVNSAVDAIVVSDEHGFIQEANPAAEAIFGFAPAELVGLNIRQLMSERDAIEHDGYLTRYRGTDVKRIIGRGRVLEARRKDGSTFPIELTVAEWYDPLGRRCFTGIMRDITERQQAETALREAQADLLRVSRLSAMGAMASTLAHELNQPLTAVANFVRAGRRQLLNLNIDDDLLEETLREAADEALHAGEIIRRIRRFTSVGEVASRPEDLASLVDTALNALLQRESADTLIVERDFGPEVFLVEVDRVQIEQVLVNILRNALDAMASEPVRRIRIGASFIDGDVEMRIADSGPGLTPEAHEALFQPFRSGKSDGFGLGLSISRTIIEAHGGRIWALPPGEAPGAIFCLTLPACRMPVAA